MTRQEDQMVTQQRIAADLRSEREALTSYLESIPEAAWDKASLCEGWTIRQLMAHVVGIASDVANRRLDDVGSAEQNQRQVDEREGATPSDILSEWKREGESLEEGVLELDDALWTTPYSDNFTVGQSLQRMVEDIWVHTQDIRIPLSDGTTQTVGLTSTLEVGVRELLNRLPLHAPEVGTLTIEAGDFASTVPGAGSTDVTIAGDPVTLALVSTGRIALDDALADGKLTVTPAAPAGLAKAINIYAT